MGRVRSYRTFSPLLEGKYLQRYISVALVLGSPPAGVTRYPCPVKPGLSSPGAFRPPAAAVQPGCEQYCTANNPDCQIPLQILFFAAILYEDMRYKIPPDPVSGMIILDW